MTNIHPWNLIRQSGQYSCSKQALSTGNKNELPREVKHNWWRKFSRLGMKQKHKSGREGRTSAFYPCWSEAALRTMKYLVDLIVREMVWISYIRDITNTYRIKGSIIYEINGTYSLSVFLCRLHSLLLRVEIYYI